MVSTIKDFAKNNGILSNMIHMFMSHRIMIYMFDCMIMNDIAHLSIIALNVSVTKVALQMQCKQMQNSLVVMHNFL